MSVIASADTVGKHPDYTDLISRLGSLSTYSKEVEMGLRLEAVMALEDLSARLRDLMKHTVPAPRISSAALDWLSHGSRGISSNTIFSHVTGLDVLHGTAASHPHDPADFRRCRLLLDQVTEVAVGFHKMRTLTPTWAALVDHWDELCQIMDKETPRWKTGEGRGLALDARMREIISESRKRAQD